MRSDLFAALLGTAIVCTAPAVAASPTTFTYQGHLAQDGDPAEGAYEFEIRLLDNLGVQIGMTQTASEIVNAGTFSMELDFGNGAFDGNARYLEISVRSVAAGGAYVVLSPNQPVTSIPVAQFALNGNEGPVGPQGIPGSDGTDGTDGAAGTDGATGPQGNQGPQGAQGIQGIPGPDGDQGDQGTPGDSHWVLSGTDTYYTGGNVGIGINSPNFPLTVETSGIVGISTKSDLASGLSYGLFSVAHGSDGRGVYGGATSATGETYGGKFVAASVNGRAVYGTATSTTGTNFGVRGKTSSPDGYAGYFQGGRNYFQGNVGIGTDNPEWPIHVVTSSKYGMYLETSHSQTFTAGIQAITTASSGFTSGVAGTSKSSEGRGVQGHASSSSGSATGVYGQADSSNGTGVEGTAQAVTGINYGVKGFTASSAGYAGYFIGGRNYFQGNVGIGTASPSDKLHVNAPAGEDAMRIQTNGSTRIRVNANGGVSLGGNSTNISAGNVYIPNKLGIGTNAPTFDLSVSGTAAKTGGGSWAVFSDQRLKKNIVSMAGSLDMISALRPVNFEYTAKDHFSYTPGVQLGFIAQEVAKVIPQWVNTADDGYYYLDQVGYEALIVDAIQELRAEKDAEIQELRARLDRLERMMALSIDR